MFSVIGLDDHLVPLAVPFPQQRLASPDLPHWIAPPFIEWADCVLYACRDGERRLLRTEGTNVILAKNRYSLPTEVPLSWDALMQSMNGQEVQA